MKTLAPSVTTRDPKGLKFVSIIEAAYNNARLSEEEAQRINETPGLSELFAGFIADNRTPNKFKDEEVPSKYGYLSGYEPTDLQTQKAILTLAFPRLKGFSPGLLTQVVEGKLKLPQDAEGWFAIPNWIKNSQIFGKTYSEALLTVIEAIKVARDGKFYNWREGQINEKSLRQSVRSKQFWNDLSEAQGHPDILIVPAQFGIRHRGRSVRRARETFVSNEFGLGAFAVGIMVLTHPKRLKHYDDLWIDCAGDEFDDSGSGVRFGRAPCFFFGAGRVEFDAGFASDAYEDYGSASGLVPQ